jgi:hypothetical protein
VLLPEQIEEAVCEAAIAVREKRHMPRPRHALKLRGEAVERDQRRRPACRRRSISSSMRA